jgi:uncharacterized membrane protein YtjA (UPF0391 family)
MFVQSTLITATLGSLFGFFTMTGVDNAVAQIMVGLALMLVVAILVTGRWDLPYKVPLSET